MQLYDFLQTHSFSIYNNFFFSFLFFIEEQYIKIISSICIIPL